MIQSRTVRVEVRHATLDYDRDAEVILTQVHKKSETAILRMKAKRDINHLAKYFDAALFNYLNNTDFYFIQFIELLNSQFHHKRDAETLRKYLFDVADARGLTLLTAVKKADIKTLENFYRANGFTDILEGELFLILKR